MAADRRRPYPDDSVANAAVFIDWRRRHFAADLAAFDEDDVVEFLLDWCRRRDHDTRRGVILVLRIDWCVA